MVIYPFAHFLSTRFVSTYTSLFLRNERSLFLYACSCSHNFRMFFRFWLAFGPYLVDDLIFTFNIQYSMVNVTDSNNIDDLQGTLRLQC